MKQQQVHSKKFSKKRWTKDEQLRLKQIYEEELAKNEGEGLWPRIWKRVSTTVRKTSIVSLTYKWRNYLADQTKAKNLIFEQKLKEMIISQAPIKGFKALTQQQPFKNMTTANMKNIFHSGIRTIARYITFINHKEDQKQNIQLLSNRTLLKLLASKDMNLLNLRRNVYKLKTIIGRMKKFQSLKDLKGNEIDEVSHLRQEILRQFELIRTLRNCVKSGFRQEIEDRSSINQSNSAQINAQIPSKLQFALQVEKSSNPHLKERSNMQQQQFAKKATGQDFNLLFFRPFTSCPSLSCEIRQN